MTKSKNKERDPPRPLKDSNGCRTGRDCAPESPPDELSSQDDRPATTNPKLRPGTMDPDAASGELIDLIIASGVATILLDAELRVRQFATPDTGLFKLLESDIGRSLEEVAPRLPDESLLTDCRNASSTLEAVEKEIRTSDGRCFLRRVVPHRGSDGRIGGIAVSVVDITAQANAESRIRHLASVLRDSNDAVIIATMDGRITGWNRGAERAYGYSESEALTLEFHQIVPEPRRRTATEAVSRILRGEYVPSYQSQRITKDGRIVDVEVTLTPLRDENGQLVELARTERDITARLQRDDEIRRFQTDLERRVAERTNALRDSDRRIRAILDATADAIVTIDSTGTIETFNRAAEIMFGYAADEALGSNVSILMGEPYRTEHQQYLTRFATTGAAHLIGGLRDLTGRRKDGTEFPIQLSVTPVDTLGLFTGVIRDVTEQRALQEEIVRVAADEQRWIGQELHDSVQQELTGLGLLAQHLAEADANLERDEIRKLANRLAKGIYDANRHVRRLARGLVPVAVDAEGLMASLSELASQTEAETGIACRFVCPSPVVVADDLEALHLFRIAQEAVNNAVKHASASAITIQLEHAPDGTILAVRDDGIGISPDDRSKNSLGLRLMAHRCGLLGGSLSVSRRDRGGTEVLCRIPILKGEKRT